VTPLMEGENVRLADVFFLCSLKNLCYSLKSALFLSILLMVNLLFVLLLMADNFLAATSLGT
jgi:hypothetical protein